MTGLFFAWAIGEGVIFYRWAKAGAPPTPGVLAMSSSLFVGLAIIGEYRPARPVVTAFAFAVDLAILMQVLGKGPQQQTGWPPALINDPTAILPTGRSASGSVNPSDTPANVGGANAANGAPASTPANPGTPPEGSGVIYPPGSQSF